MNHPNSPLGKSMNEPITERELLLANSKESLVDMMIRERIIHSTALKERIESNRQVLDKLNDLIALVKGNLTR